MPIPGYQDMMLPVLESLADGSVRSRNQIRDSIAERFSLNEEERKELIPSGKVTLLANRVGWAITYLFKVRALDRPARGQYSLTDRGRALIASNPGRVDNQVLSQFPEFQEFTSKKNDESPAAGHESQTSLADALTPEEAIQKASRDLEEALADEVLERVQEMDWFFFEHLVLRLLRAMDYGGRSGEAQHLGGSGDKGVDGVIREDALGLDRIYIQAKHWKDKVGRPEMHRFVGALAGKNASKGVFITTSAFSKDATEYASTVPHQIVLIDGQRLARLMIDYDVGVSVSTTYEIKTIDSDFFKSPDSD